MVTRCPLVLHLKKCKTGESSWGQFSHLPGQKFTPEEVEAEIMKRTDELTGEKCTVSEQEIFLTFNSPDVDELSLVDLPGLVKNPKEGQPKTIVKDIENLALKYIKEELSIILAITIANDDMVNSESLRLAKEYDNKGSRTIAVLTKVDLMDPGTSATSLPKMLSGEQIRITRGIVGVKNRSSSDVVEKRSVAESRKSETAWWQDRYPELASTNGIEYLSRKLHGMLRDHIKANLPGVKEQLNRDLKKAEEELKKLGEKIDSSAYQKHLREKIIPPFSKLFGDYCEGKELDVDQEAILRAPRFGASKFFEITRQLEERFKGIQASDYTVDEVLNVLKKVELDQPPSISKVAFESLFKPSREALRTPSLGCITDIAAEMKHVCDKMLQRDNLSIGRFPGLVKEVHNIVYDLIDEHAGLAKKMVESSLDIEKHVTYTVLTDEWNFHYLTSPGKIPFKDPFTKSSTLDQKTRSDLAVLGQKLDEYFDFVSGRIHNTVTKVAYTMLLQPVVDTVQSKLSISLHNVNEKWFEEVPDIADARIRCSEKVKVYRKALDFLAGI